MLGNGRFICFMAALLATQLSYATTISLYFPIAVGGPIAKNMDALIREFERDHTDIQVTPVYAGTYQETIAKVLTANRNGTPPTVAVLFAADIHTLIDSDAILPYEDLLESDEDAAWLHHFYPALMYNSRVADKTWGIPFQRSTILLYWNKALFQSAGLNPERPPANWQEMNEYARKLTMHAVKGRPMQWGIELPATGFPYWVLQGMAIGRGQVLMNEAGTQTYFDHPAVVEALQAWVDMAQKERIHPSELVEWGSVSEDFLKQKAAMVWTSSGNLSYLRSNAEFDFGVAMLPGVTRRGSPTGGGNFYVFRNSQPEQRKAALKLVRWLVSTQHTAQWSMASGYIAVRPEAWNTALMKKYVADFPYATVARDQLEYAVAELSTHSNQRVTAVLNAAITAALRGEKSPLQALQDAQYQAAKILRPYQR